MSIGKYTIGAPRKVDVGLFREILRSLVHASDRIDNPYLISDTDSPVFADIPHELSGPGLPGRLYQLHCGRIRILLYTFEIRPDIVSVNILPCGNISGRMANREAVFYDVFAFCNIPAGNLVATIDVFFGRQPKAADFQCFTGCNVLQCYGHIVLVDIDLKQLAASNHLAPPLHKTLSLYQLLQACGHALNDDLLQISRYGSGKAGNDVQVETPHVCP